MFLVEDSRVSLPREVLFDDHASVLTDVASASTISLNGSAGFLVGVIASSSHPIAVRELVRAQVLHYGTSPEHLLADTIDLLLDLNRSYVLTIHYSSSLKRRLQMLSDVFKLGISGTLPVFRTIRHAPSLPQLSAATFLAFFPLLVVSILISGIFDLAFFVNTSGISPKALATFSLPTLVLLGFALTGVAHEGAHIGAAKRAGVRTAYVIRHFGSTFSVVHRSTPDKNRRIALAGPCAGVLAGALMATLIGDFLNLFGVDSPVEHWMLTSLVLPHAWALMPFSKDGAFIWNRQ